MIQVDHAIKRYRDVSAVDDVSLTARPGEILALLGPNGAGKTSLVRMIVGITRPDSGSVRVTVDGAPAKKHQLGYLPEERGLHKSVPILRILSFIGRMQGMRRADARAAALAWLERLGLADRAGSKIEELSRGNQQKVQLAASVLHRPRVAVLDEPFSGLDPVNQELFIELLGELRARETTVLLSAHQMSLVERVADRVVLLARGRVALRGSLEELSREHSTGDAYDVTLTRPVDLERDVAPLRDRADTRSVEPTDDGVRVIVAAGQPLGPVLAALDVSAIAAVRREVVTLHDVYVDAVSADPREVAA